MDRSIDRGRRAFLGLEEASAVAQQSHQTECHISSVLVHVRPELQAQVVAWIGALPGVETQPPQTTGKLIATLETTSTTEIMERLESIQSLPGVVAVALVYHQWEAASGSGPRT
jgi:nitrate reductase NapD